VAGLVADGNGNLFGTTVSGGANAQGNVFELPHGSTTISPIVSFAAGGGPRDASGTLLIDNQGNLFGTSQFGGSLNQGTIFEVPAGSSQVTLLASFVETNGGQPNAALIEDSQGNLFGTAAVGGINGQPGEGDGVVFELAAGSHTPTVLANFNNAAGAAPLGNLLADAQGDLFGTTNIGGSIGFGSVFELPAGSNTPVTLVNFNDANGEFPEGGLIADSRGDLFGVAPGGANGDGVIFELSPTAVPEPAGLLAGVCFAALLMRRAKR
jgi:uncharacterized repeat protein (TIGR03803 family)